MNTDKSHAEKRALWSFKPRPLYLVRYDEVPDCGYKPTQMNFAMHVRMGDRRAIQGGLDNDYFTYLHRFMDDVTEAVVSKGLEPPMFHVYTQTLLPCPSRDTGLFVEFPLWPVEMDQVRIVCKAFCHSRTI